MKRQTIIKSQSLSLSFFFLLFPMILLLLTQCGGGGGGGGENGKQNGGSSGETAIRLPASLEGGSMEARLTSTDDTPWFSYSFNQGGKAVARHQFQKPSNYPWYSGTYKYNGGAKSCVLYLEASNGGYGMNQWNAETWDIQIKGTNIIGKHTCHRKDTNNWEDDGEYYITFKNLDTGGGADPDTGTKDYAPQNLINAELKTANGDTFYFGGNSARWVTGGISYDGNGLYTKDASTKNKARLKFINLIYVMSAYPTYTYIKHSFDGQLTFSSVDHAVYSATQTTETKSSTGTKTKTLNVSFSFTVKHD